ncbi:sugar ABC transporter ATP-binding protein [Curvibacter sp. CHRR-16]|uniref:sugar ABC transporter ATP-binding protein n=1 Tax=Curvibacter sp. CHRR-16 TaxID=2835872 RepID=UPI001BDA45EB|nr:sugar ABC transporter ATP-binding protein [Curvibacter sp. CHRR-16]MBT0570553.1 sugar ABC transporter ATP-binding protein [Curvibacter sp. CHRR-16]
MTRADSSPSTAALRMQLAGIGKTYAGPVLADVSLSLQAGQVLALTGENGAGKSTLSKIICGLVSPSSGSMLLDGQAFAPTSRRDAEAQGVRMVMQELGLIPTLSVAENLLLDRLPHRAGWLKDKELRALAQAQLDKMGIHDIDPATPVGQLGIGQQQMVEIARNLQDSTRVLILDEPTAMLTARETEHLFAQIALLKQRGVALIYVSHRLEELQRIADQVAVLRDGLLVDVRPMAGVQEAELVERMVGHHVHEDLQRPIRPAGPVLLRAHGIGRGKAVQGVDLELRAGQIMGIAGLVGAGRTECIRLLYGADRMDSGKLEVFTQASQRHGLRGPWRSPMQAMRAGIGLVTEDRKSQGLLLPQSIRVNMTLSDVPAIARAGWLRSAHEHGVARSLIERLRVRSHSEEQPVSTLSGGNQQKVVLARWLHRECEVLLLDEPTRGVDVGARAEIYAELEQMAAAGKALLVVSSDLRELLALCDRIGVMHAGRLVQTFERGAWSEQAILAAAFGESTQPNPTTQTL